MVIRELKSRGINVKAVERSKQVPGVEIINADLLNVVATKEALKGASHAYLCVGLPYDSKIWAESWSKLMQSVIAACSQNGTRLIFLDNVYMYGPSPLSVPFTEQEPQSP